MFTKPPRETEDPLLCLQSLLLTQMIHYRVYKASCRARRSIVITKPVNDPEDSLPCLQSLLLSQKIHDCVYNACYWPRIFFTVFTKPLVEPEDPLQILFITVFTKHASVSFCSWHIDRPISSNGIRKIFPKPSGYMLNELTLPLVVIRQWLIAQPLNVEI